MVKWTVMSLFYDYSFNIHFLLGYFLKMNVKSLWAIEEANYGSCYFWFWKVYFHSCLHHSWSILFLLCRILWFTAVLPFSSSLLLETMLCFMYIYFYDFLLMIQTFFLLLQIFYTRLTWILEVYWSMRLLSQVQH